MQHPFPKYFKIVVSNLIWLSLLIGLIFLTYAFYHHKTQLLGFTFINPFYDLIMNMPVWVYAIICSTFISVFSLILFTILSFYYSIQRSRIAKIRAKYYKFFSYILTNYFLLDLYKEEHFRNNLFFKIRSNLKTRVQLTAFLESYLKIQETLAINLSDDFKLLIDKLSLGKKIESFIYHNKYDDRILAMKVISYLRIHTCDKQIRKNAQSNNYALRAEAYAALIRLMEKDEYLVKFIGEKHRLSMLDINIIVNAVLKNRKINIDYKALLSSENTRKIMIGLLLAKYRYTENKNNFILILNYLGNANPEFNKMAWDALLTLAPKDEVVDLIIDRFDRESEEVKLLILDKSDDINNERFIYFLNSIIEHQSLLVKIKALKIILNSDWDLDLIEIYENSQNTEINKAYKELSCVYINN